MGIDGAETAAEEKKRGERDIDSLNGPKLVAWANCLSASSFSLSRMAPVVRAFP